MKSIEELKAIPNVVGVAGGTDKVEAIQGALAGQYIDVLVTTEEVARALLADPEPHVSTEPSASVTTQEEVVRP